MKRTIVRRVTMASFAIALAGFVVAVATVHPASAQFANGFDPVATTKSFVTNNDWLGKAQGWAKTIYVGLIIFEIIALGITTLLFRDNLGEFFASIGLKLVMGSVFFWFISVAGPGISQLPGEVVTGTFGNTFGKGLGGTDDVASIASQGAIASAAYFAASYAMRAADGVKAAVTEVATPVPPDPNPANCTEVYVYFSGGGTCYEQPARTVAFGRQAAENVTSGLGMMLGMAVAAIYLQYAMITIETYFVMTAGVLFVGFAASRFTAPFSQGYFTYMITVGVKLMVFYIVLGIAGPMVLGILADAIGTLATAIADPTGFSSLALALFGTLSVVVTAGLVYAAPGLAASFLTGQSSVSGSALASQALRSLAGGAQVMAQMSASNQARKAAVADEKEAAADAGKHGGSANSGGMSPARPNDHESFKPSGNATQAHSGGASDAAQHSVLNDTLGMQRPPGGTSGGPDRAREQSLLDDAKREKASSEMSTGYAASAVASAAPQETAQPAAVQVRVGTPDRL